MITNPVKVFTVERSIESIKQFIPRITEFSGGKLTLFDDIINDYEFDLSRFMIGDIITMSLASKSETQTEIKLEARRVMGAYDKPLEVSSANANLKNIASAISTLIKDPDAKTSGQIEADRVANMTPEEKKKKNKKDLIWSIIVLLALFLMLIISQSCEKEPSPVNNLNCGHTYYDGNGNYRPTYSGELDGCYYLTPSGNKAYVDRKFCPC